ncbi:hypothetical protein BC629DRAFT_1534599 [Irpex lacteus]|nr:hypothetical protein BC629DRAFT_1534599 [Irpex lacteus]
MDDFRRRHSRPQTAPSPFSSRARGRSQLRSPHSISTTSRAGGNGNVTSKIVSSKHSEGLSAVGMYSTPEESLSPASSRDDLFSRPQTSPTVQQIAMGLHLSRTPHLGSSKAYNPRTRIPDSPSAASSRPTPRRRDSAPPTIIQLPPPPARSALKKPNNTALESTSLPSLAAPLTPSDSRTSLSTMTSTNGPSTPRSNRSNSLRPTTFASRLQSSMSRLLQPMRKNSTSSIVTTSTATSGDSSSAELTPRKIVRFSSSARGGEEDA